MCATEQSVWMSKIKIASYDQETKLVQLKQHITEQIMLSTPNLNAHKRLILSIIMTVVCLVSTTSLIVLWTPDQTGIPETVLPAHPAN